jgi:hypothetical protein
MTSVQQQEAAATLVAANTARSVQLAVRARLMQDVAKAWPLLDSKRLNETFPIWLRAMMLLTRNYHSQSSVAAGRFYRQARQLATDSPAPQSLIRLAEPPVEEWMTRAFGYSGPGLLSRDTARPKTALSTTLGTASRIALDGGRTTILNTTRADKIAVGWYRVTDGDPCAFCALLASRGIVYSEHTADFETHNDCGCSAAPAFSRNQALPELNRIADRIYTDHAAGAGSGRQLAAFRKAWAEHQANSAA